MASTSAGSSAPSSDGGGRHGRPRNPRPPIPDRLKEAHPRWCPRCHKWKAGSDFSTATTERCIECSKRHAERSRQLYRQARHPPLSEVTLEYLLAASTGVPIRPAPQAPLPAFPAHRGKPENVPPTAQADHGAARRADEEVSPTQCIEPLRPRPGGDNQISAVRIHPNPSGNGHFDVKDTYFVCSICYIPRAAHRRINNPQVEAHGLICTYCNNHVTGKYITVEMKWCRQAHHECPRIGFFAPVDDGKSSEHEICSACIIRTSTAGSDFYPPVPPLSFSSRPAE
ncbi:hypothetical protein F4820DRAFT_405498 [Hypoxylon rubiginosum]|uniref:Uncharacterized protein n=1 Tax=Hypoxylon rubiginosum TaxID=110542 RepID=A0ACB9ZEH5_9PEZI|nr:hypothetical protein F4820DRAFT_405498 [Hypoxylon rubiginosum]